jgi:hypothetical protein
MAYVLTKRGKYMEGHGYATGLGYRYSWTRDIGKARRFADDDSSTDAHASRTGARILHLPNTRKECKELYKRSVNA